MSRIEYFSSDIQDVYDVCVWTGEEKFFSEKKNVTRDNRRNFIACMVRKCFRISVKLNDIRIWQTPYSTYEALNELLTSSLQLLKFTV